jgi:hypothetical protein
MVVKKQTGNLCEFREDVFSLLSALCFGLIYEPRARHGQIHTARGVLRTAPTNGAVGHFSLPATAITPAMPPFIAAKSTFLRGGKTRAREEHAVRIKKAPGKSHTRYFFDEL